MMIKFNLVLSVLAFAISCTRAGWQDNVISDINLARFRNNNVNCTGLLYRDNVVLTSAFCADNLRRNTKITLTNVPGNKSGLATFKVVASIYYPEYDGDFKNPVPVKGSRTNDLGIILITTDEDLPTIPRKVKITKDELSTYPESKVTTFAWREVSKDKTEVKPDYDQFKVMKKELSRSENLEIVKGSFWFRTRASTRSKYQYDLGSPVLSNENGKILLVGIVSQVNHRNGLPTYLRVIEIYKIHDWIEDKITDLTGSK